MFRPKKRSLAESLVALVSADLVIYVYFHYLSGVFYDSVSFREYAALSGLLSLNRADGTRLSEAVLSSYIVCMREARPDLSMRKTPCMNHEPPVWSNNGVELAPHASFPLLSCSPACLAHKLNHKPS